LRTHRRSKAKTEASPAAYQREMLAVQSATGGDGVIAPRDESDRTDAEFTIAHGRVLHFDGSLESGSRIR